MSTAPVSDNITSSTPLPLWRNRDYVLLTSGQLVSSLGSRISLLAFPLLVWGLTHSAFWTGIIAGLRSIPYVLLVLPVGALVDRWDRKRVMWLSDAGRAIAIGSIPIALWMGHLTIWHLAGATLIEGTLFVFYNMAETACIPRVVAPSQIGTAISQSSAIDSGVSFVGSSLSGVMLSLNVAVPFISDTISYLASIVSLRWITTSFQDVREQTPRHLVAEIREGMAWLWGQPVMRFLAFALGSLNLFSMGYTVLIIGLAKHLAVSDSAIGLIFATGGLGSIIGAAITPVLRRRFGTGPVLIWSTWIWALTWFIYPLAQNGWMLALGNIAAFIIVPVYSITQYSYRLEMIPDHLQGRVNSVYRLIAFGAEPLSLAIAGALVQVIGPVWAIIVIALPQVIIAIITHLRADLRALR